MTAAFLVQMSVLCLVPCLYRAKQHLDPCGKGTEWVFRVEPPFRIFVEEIWGPVMISMATIDNYWWKKGKKPQNSKWEKSSIMCYMTMWFALSQLQTSSCLLDGLKDQAVMCWRSCNGHRAQRWKFEIKVFSVILLWSIVNQEFLWKGVSSLRLWDYFYHLVKIIKVIVAFFPPDYRCGL